MRKILLCVVVIAVICVAIPLVGFLVYTRCFWQRWSPARIERITEVRVPKYKIVKYDKRFKGHKQVFYGDIDIKFKSMPDDRIFHKIDSIIAVGRSYWRKEGDTYKLTFSDALVKKYLNTLVKNETGKSADETIQIDELKDFTYEATEKDGMITDIVYKGTLTVDVPGSLLTSGEDTSYPLDLNIKIKFVNPGEAVSIELPSTDDFEEVK
jgi:hypothetical protein